MLCSANNKPAPAMENPMSGSLVVFGEALLPGYPFLIASVRRPANIKYPYVTRLVVNRKRQTTAEFSDD